MNDYGNMPDAMRRVAAYQQCEIHHLPGHGENHYMVGVHEGGERRYDVFELRTDKDLNAALNRLYGRLS